MPFNAFRSLRGRLILASLVALVPLLGLHAKSQRRVRADAREQWESNARFLVQGVARSYADVITETRILLSVLATLPELQNPSPDHCERFLRPVFDSQSRITGMGLVAPDGVTVCLTSGPGEYDISPQPYFQEALRTKAFSTSDFHLAANPVLQPIVAAAQPVLGPDGSIRSVVALGIHLGEVARSGQDLPGATLVLFDATGDVLATRPETPAMLDTKVSPLLLGAMESGPGRENATIIRGVDPDGAEKVFAMVPITSDDGQVEAYLALDFDPELIAAQIAQASQGGLFGLAVTAVAILAGLGLFLEFALMRRLVPIIRASQRLGEGDLSARTGIDSGPLEIRHLARTFDQMAERLQTLREDDARITARELEARDHRFEQLAKHIEGAFWMWDPGDQRMLYLSPGFEKIWGRSAEEAYADPSVLMDVIHEEDRDIVRRRAKNGHLEEGEYRYRIVRPDGSIRWIRNRSFAIRDPDGSIYRYVGLAEDATKDHELQQTLRQSQKLEAVGRLAGGVAHDFNNVLTAIRGNAHLVLSELEEGPLREDVEEIDRAAERAASLTRQLLAFSRKQAFSPRALDLNDVVTRLSKMLQTLLGERIDLVTELAPDVGTMRADENHLEQALVNLVVNSKDAMPDGGTLTIRTRNHDLRTGELTGAAELMPRIQYVVVDVQDTGCGMDEEVASHIFEPFYTTKGQGQGTGLGLPSVYGTVKQSQGFIWLDTNPGEGATFSLYFPLAEDSDVEEVDSGGRATLAKGSGTILLVEDEEAVRSVARRTLSRAGYDVVEARDGQEALELFERHEGTFALLVTDIVMPRLNGPELYEKLKQQDADLPVLFMSGYPGRNADGDLLVHEGAPFLQKPFTSTTLALEVRERLRAV